MSSTDVQRAVGAVAYDNHWGQLSSVLPEARGFLVLAAPDTVVWSSSDAPASLIANAVAALDIQAFRAVPSADAVTRREIDSTTVLYAVGLASSLEQPAAVIGLIVDGEHGETAQTRIESILAGAAACITREYELNLELDAMATELAERYDELNLAYQTTDETRDFDQGREALAELVQNCCDYLDVGLSALIVPKDGVALCRANPGQVAGEVPELLGNLEDHLFEQLVRTDTPLVINDVNDPWCERLYAGAKLKLLACPIPDTTGRVAGAVVVLRLATKPDFANSDRNLLEVMARKAAKILQANFDGLTGLMNRQCFEHRAQQLLESARTQARGHCMLNINIDRLQLVNDNASYEAGDELLRKCGRRIREQVRDCDIVARLSGDEFAVLLVDSSLTDGGRAAERIREAVGAGMFEWQGAMFEVSASIGLVQLSADTDRVASAMGAAEVACEAAKEHGRDRIQIFEASDSALSQRKSEIHWAARIQAALRERRFEVYSQPIVPLRDPDAEMHYEILLRLKDEEGNMVSPGLFMPAAERFNLMPAIDRWVVNETLTLLSEKRSRWPAGKSIWAMNLSGQSLSETDFLEYVVNELHKSALPPECVCFEVTETAAVANIEEAQHFIAVLQEMGCRFSLDDFGTGLSSFAYLKDLPVDYLKIDGVFVKEIVSDETSSAMVAAINQLGHALNMATIAEWVENDAIRKHLEALGIDYAQGYGVGKPQPLTLQLADYSDLEERRRA